MLTDLMVGMGGEGKGYRWIKCGPCPQGGGLDIRSVWKQNKFNQQAFIEHLLCVWRYLDTGDPALNKTYKKTLSSWKVHFIGGDRNKQIEYMACEMVIRTLEENRTGWGMFEDCNFKHVLK